MVTVIPSSCEIEFGVEDQVSMFCHGEDDRFGFGCQNPGNNVNPSDRM